jgi:Brp/Blh family beta-carotene 15,15'-monooxygenase
MTALVCRLQTSSYGSTRAGHDLLDSIALIAIAVAVWHGAYDAVLARPRFQPRLGRWWIPAFACGYLSLIVATLAMWHVAPAGTLVAFLLYSSWHFGTEQDAGPLTLGRAATALALGTLPIAAACAWHRNQVNEIFSSMLGAGGNALFAQQLSGSCAALLWPLVAVAALGACLGLLGTSRAARLTMLCLVALELLLFRVCDPLLAFALYFCLWHAPEHLVSTSLDRSGFFARRLMVRNLRAGVLPWLASLAGLAILFALRPRNPAGYASALFVFLSALTVPHMALNEMRRFATLQPSRRAVPSLQSSQP